MSVGLDAARLLALKAAMLKDAGKPYVKDAGSIPIRYQSCYCFTCVY